HDRTETRRLQLRGQPRHCVREVRAPRSLLIPCGNHRGQTSHRNADRVNRLSRGCAFRRRNGVRYWTKSAQRWILALLAHGMIGTGEVEFFGEPSISLSE